MKRWYCRGSVFAVISYSGYALTKKSTNDDRDELVAAIASAKEKCVVGLNKLAADLKLDKELALVVVTRVVLRRHLTSAGLDAFRSLPSKCKDVAELSKLQFLGRQGMT